VRPDSLDGLRVLAREHEQLEPGDWEFGDGEPFDVRACLRWAVARIEAAQFTWRIIRDGSTAKLVVGESTLELTPEQLRGMAEALASMAADIERERER
jgi:hypothetical protein